MVALKDAVNRLCEEGLKIYEVDEQRAVVPLSRVDVLVVGRGPFLELAVVIPVFPEHSTPWRRNRAGLELSRVNGAFRVLGGLAAATCAFFCDGLTKLVISHLYTLDSCDELITALGGLVLMADGVAEDIHEVLYAESQEQAVVEKLEEIARARQPEARVRELVNEIRVDGTTEEGDNDAETSGQD